MAVRKTNIDYNLGSSSLSNDHHVKNTASVLNSVHTQSTDAESNLQPALGPTDYTPEHNNSSRFPVNPSAVISITLDDPRRPVVNIDEQVSQNLAELPQSQQEQRRPNPATDDLEAGQSPIPPPPRMISITRRLSNSIDGVYATNAGLFRLLGSVLLCCGVAFSLWQGLESRGQ